MVEYENIILACSLIEADDVPRKAERSKKMYGKYQNSEGKWIYWTKIDLELLPESFAKHFNRS